MQDKIGGGGGGGTKQVNKNEKMDFDDMINGLNK